MDTLSDNFGDPGIQEVTQQALADPDVHFYLFLDRLGSLLGLTLEAFFVDFRDLG